MKKINPVNSQVQRDGSSVTHPYNPNYNSDKNRCFNSNPQDAGLSPVTRESTSKALDDRDRLIQAAYDNMGE